MTNLPRTDPRPEPAAAKAADMQLSRAVAEEVRRLAVSAGGSPLVLSAVGPATRRLPFLSYRAGLDVSVPQPDDTGADSPDLVFVELTDGSGRAERGALLREARDLLPAGGRVVVSAFVVSAPGGSVTNPRLSTLVEEIAEAFGTMVHFDEVRSLRLAGDLHSRVVLLTLTSLWPRSA